MIVIFVVMITFWAEAYSFMTRFTCDFDTSCSINSPVTCQTNYYDEIEDTRYGYNFLYAKLQMIFNTNQSGFRNCTETALSRIDFNWIARRNTTERMSVEFTRGSGPSEPSRLTSQVERNGDISDVTIQWQGPDDSSVKDLQGFEIEFEDGDIFHTFLMDLRGNDVILKMNNATSIVYSLTCRYKNPFSEAVHLKVYITSLPKPFDDNLSDKIAKGNVSIHIPRYISSTYRNRKYALRSTRPTQQPDTPSNRENIILIIVSVVIFVSFVFTGVLIIIKVKGKHLCMMYSAIHKEPPTSEFTLEKENASKSAYSRETNEVSDIKLEQVRSHVESPSRSISMDSRQVYPEVCIPFMVETVMPVQHYQPSCHSFDSGYHSYSMHQSQFYEQTPQKEYQKPNSIVTKRKDEKKKCRSLWSIVAPSDAESLTSLASEDLENEMLRFNNFKTSVK